MWVASRLYATQFGMPRFLLNEDVYSVREMMKSDQTPVRWAVIGVVDERHDG